MKEARKKQGYESISGMKVQDQDSSGEEVGGKTNASGKRITPTLSPKQLQESVYKKLKQSGGSKASRSGAHLAHLPKVIVEEESTGLKPPIKPRPRPRSENDSEAANEDREVAGKNRLFFFFILICPKKKKFSSGKSIIHITKTLNMDPHCNFQIWQTFQYAKDCLTEQDNH